MIQFFHTEKSGTNYVSNFTRLCQEGNIIKYSKFMDSGEKQSYKSSDC